MQSLNYWKQFESTGKIEDYLSYKSGCDTAYNSVIGNSAAYGWGNENSGQQGAKPYAGVRMCNRNDTEADSRWGI